MTLENLQIIRLPEVLQKVNASKPSLYRWMKAGEFPKPIKFGRRTSGWIEGEVDGWIREKMRIRDNA